MVPARRLSRYFYRNNNEFRDLAIRTPPPVDVQINMAGLAFGSLISSPGESARTGGTLRTFLSCRALALDTPHPSHRYSRAESISRHMSRLLRHGPRGGEPPLDSNLADGGSIPASALIRHQVIARMHMAQAEVSSISHEKDNGRKRRCDIEATHDGPKIRCRQCHILPATRPPDVRTRSHQRYLLHAAEPESAAQVLRGGMQQIRNIQERHFVELPYDGRQIVNKRHRRPNRVLLGLDTQLASGVGYAFTKIPNRVVFSDGIDSFIHRSVSVSEWLSDNQRISATELMGPERKIVTSDRDQSHPRPSGWPMIDLVLRPLIPENHPFPPPIPTKLTTLSLSEYQPTSPTPSQRGSPSPKDLRLGTLLALRPHPKRIRHGARQAPVEQSNVTPPKPPVVNHPPPVPRAKPIFPHAGFLTVSPPAPPQLAPNPSTLALQEQIDASVAKEVERRLARLGKPPS